MADEHLFARVRRDDEVAGIYQDVLLTRASDDMVHKMGQDGGLVSALLIWALAPGYIDAALPAYVVGSAEDRWNDRPRVAPTKDEVAQADGSRPPPPEHTQ